MRFFYLDPGLRDDVGHHANYCRFIVGELRSRGVETLVFAHHEVSPSLQTELGAVPHFRTYTYTPYGVRYGWFAGVTAYCRYAIGELRSRGVGTLVSGRHAVSPSLQALLGAGPDCPAYTFTPYSVWRIWLTGVAAYCRYIVHDLRSPGVEIPVSNHHELSSSLPTELDATAHSRACNYTATSVWRGWLTGFATFTRITCEDLSRLPAPEPADIIFATSARPVQLSALIKWRRVLPADRRPTVVVESVASGLVGPRGLDDPHIRMPDPRINPTAALFRHAARQLPREDGTRFFFVTFAPISTELFKMLLEYPVRTLPLPYRTVVLLRNRAGARPVVVAILGHQRLAKGYDRLPEIVQALLRLKPDIRLLVQSVDPSGSPETQQALRDIAATSDRMVLEETPAGKTRWPQILEMSDLILCPHRPEYYAGGFSSVLAEALANGIPVVVPGGTPLETLVTACGGPGTSFDRFAPASIAEATGRVLDEFDRFATLAHNAALRWPETRGPARMVDALMSLITAPLRSPSAIDPSAHRYS